MNKNAPLFRKEGLGEDLTDRINGENNVFLNAMKQFIIMYCYQEQQISPNPSLLKRGICFKNSTTIMFQIISI